MSQGSPLPVPYGFVGQRSKLALPHAALKMLPMITVRKALESWGTWQAERQAGLVLLSGVCDSDPPPSSHTSHIQLPAFPWEATTYDFPRLVCAKNKDLNGARHKEGCLTCDSLTKVPAGCTTPMFVALGKGGSQKRHIIAQERSKWPWLPKVGIELVR